MEATSCELVLVCVAVTFLIVRMFLCDLFFITSVIEVKEKMLSGSASLRLVYFLIINYAFIKDDAFNTELYR